MKIYGLTTCTAILMLIACSQGCCHAQNHSSGNEVKKDFMQIYNAAEALAPSAVISPTNSYPQWAVNVSLSDSLTVSVKAGPQITDDGDLAPALAKVILRYGDEGEDRTLWNYTDYAFVEDIRIDKGHKLLFFCVYLNKPGVLKWKQRRDIYAFDLGVRKQLGVQTQGRSVTSQH